VGNKEIEEVTTLTDGFRPVGWLVWGVDGMRKGVEGVMEDSAMGVASSAAPSEMFGVAVPTTEEPGT
jgi:hypothetical protein